MLRRLLTFPDARGQRWSILRLVSGQHRAASPWRRRLTLLLVLLALCPIMLIISTNAYLALTHASAQQLGRHLLTLLPTMLIAFTLGAICMILMVRQVAPRIAAATVAKGRCPACGHSLANLPPADPITCPECGAAWHPAPSEPASTN
jgi:hypothetical protein